MCARIEATGPGPGHLYLVNTLSDRFREVIGLEVDKALTQLEDLRTDYVNAEKDVEEP
jgi:hypothetical protein